MSYGFPYMGSKSKICKNICGIFPKTEHFYDLFGGGFSVTHFMLENRIDDFKYFHFNEIRLGICELIKDAIAGKYNYKNFKPEWISREEFFKQKESNPYIKLCWSFGNTGNDYLFGKDIEQYKKSMHNAIIFNEFDELAIKTFGMNKFRDEFNIKDRRLFLRNKAIINNNRIEKRQLQQLQQLERLQQLEQLQQLQQLKQLQQLERLQQLQQLERLQQLQQLERLHKLNFYNTSYENIEIKSSSIIYCDIPYEDTDEYDKNKSFNRGQFLDWADQQPNPVFISEYQINDDRFKEIYKIAKRSMLSATKTTGNKFEKIYVNKSGYKKMIEMLSIKNQG